MTDRPVVVRLFVEDLAHEQFVRALVGRLAREEGVGVDLRIGIAQGGHGRVIGELKIFQRVKAPQLTDILVVVIDANCKGWHVARADVLGSVEATLAGTVVVGCPDPHVEKWFLADPDSLAQHFGVVADRSKSKCERKVYKTQLVRALRDAGQTVTLGGTEFAEEIVAFMDLFKAGRNEASLKHFVKEIRAAIRSRSSAATDR